MVKFSLRAEGLYNEDLDMLVDLPDDAAAECAAIQMLAELRMNASGTLADGIRWVAVHDAGGEPVLDVTLTVSKRFVPRS